MTDRIADLADPAEGDRRDQVLDASDPDASDPEFSDPHAAVTPATESGSRWARHRERRRTRVSRWDRPPQPRDWRYFVGTVGKVLIATGLLMFGFVAYQLWGTGIETARAQNRLEDAFEQAIAATVVDDDLVPSTTAVDEGDGDGPVDGPLPELPDPVPSEVVPGGVDLSDIAVDQEIPAIDRGDVIARLEIPEIDKDLYVVAGVTLDDLKDGPGHYDDTPLPGQLGNAAIAGHRTTYGAPFFDVDQLGPGDQLVVTMVTGDRFVYAVTGVEVVSASDYWVVTTRDPTVAELTLTSCHPKYTARDRIVVHSVLVPELSSNVGAAEFYELDDSDAETVPGDDPTVTDPSATTPRDDDMVAPVDDGDANDLVDGAEDDETGGAVPATVPPDEPVDDIDAAPTSPEPGAVDDPEQLDAFSQGWFEDAAAWPQIALWGLALILISVLAYQLSKRTRHTSVGFLVGIAPFLVCLYFFYQNVNRLLPPGL